MTPLDPYEFALSLLRNRSTVATSPGESPADYQWFQGVVQALHFLAELGIIHRVESRQETQTGKRYIALVEWKVLHDPGVSPLKQAQWRRIILRRLSRHSDASQLAEIRPEDFANLISKDQIAKACSDLDERGLIKLTLTLDGTSYAAITAKGMAVDEGEPEEGGQHVQNINIGSVSDSNFQIGNGNTLNAQSVQVQLQSLVQAINAAERTPAEKEEAKSRLRAFLEHPLVVTLLGAAAQGVISTL